MNSEPMHTEPKWTFDTLKLYVDRVFEEKEKALNAALIEKEKSLASAKEAVLVAEKNAEKWRDNANEWRGAMTDREQTFLSRGEFQQYKEATEKALQEEQRRGDKAEGRSTGSKDSQTNYDKYIYWIIILGMFLINYFKK